MSIADDVRPGLPAVCAELRLQSADGVPVVNSRDVAEMFEKPHKDVLASIRALEIGEDFRRSHYRRKSSADSYGRQQPSFDLTRQGFTLLVMGWTGEKAMQFKVRYIEAFDAMEAALKESAPVTERALLSAVREIVVPLSVRFDSQDKEIGYIKNDVTQLRADVAVLQRKIVRRMQITPKTKAEHVDAVSRLGGRCPCCGLCDVVRDGQRMAPAEFDHFYANSASGADHTWLICKPCHDELSAGRVARDQRETLFKAYQELRRSLSGRQIALSLF